MQEQQTEIEIGGTLQQRISSCLSVMDKFLRQDEAIVSSIVVAEKRSFGAADNVVDCVANIMGKLQKIKKKSSILGVLFFSHSRYRWRELKHFMFFFLIKNANLSLKKSNCFLTVKKIHILKLPRRIKLKRKQQFTFLDSCTPKFTLNF